MAVTAILTTLRFGFVRRALNHRNQVQRCSRARRNRPAKELGPDDHVAEARSNSPTSLSLSNIEQVTMPLLLSPAFHLPAISKSGPQYRQKLSIDLLLTI